MNIESFFHVLTFCLMNKKVPSNRISSILREPFDNSEINSLGVQNANEFLAKHSQELPTISVNDWSYALQQYEQNLKLGIVMLCINQADYPKYLRVIKDAPPILFIRGNVNIFSELPGVAIVGARQSTPNGQIIARKIARYMCEQGFPVVSGLALGIDAAAHQGALDVDGKTIAVLAGGLDKASPVANSSLGQQILENGGAWVSEHPVGVPPRKHHFVPRNRIQVGLSAGSIIVEANVKSGSISQARFCVGQNRPLFAVVPHEMNNPLGLNSEGTLHMVSELGAIPIKTKDDYLKIITMLQNEKKVIS